MANNDLIKVNIDATLLGIPPNCVEARVIMEIAARRKVGVNKYGTSMERGDLSRKQWLQHAKEEALDLAIYLEKLISLEP